MRYGSGDSGELTFLDLVSLISFCIGLQNLELNIDQNDMDAQTKDIDEKSARHINSALAEIHAHLEQQDNKIDAILMKLGVQNDSR